MNDDWNGLILRALLRYLLWALACAFRITLLCTTLGIILLGTDGLLYHSASIAALERLVAPDTLWKFLAQTPRIGNLIGDITGLFEAASATKLATVSLVSEMTNAAVLALILPFFKKIDQLIAELSERIFSCGNLGKWAANFLASVLVIFFAICCTQLLFTPLCALTERLAYHTALVVIPLCVFLVLLLASLISSRGCFSLKTVWEATFTFIKDVLCVGVAHATVTAIRLIAVNACETPAEEGLAIAIIVLGCLFLSFLLSERLKSLIVPK